MYRDRFQSLRHTWRCHDGDLVRGLPPAAGGGPRRGHHLDRDARLLPAAGPQLGGHARPGPRRGRSLRAALRPPPARHVAGRVRLRPRRRRAPARGGDPLLLRRHARHPVRRPPPGVRRLRAALLPERRGRLRPRHRVVRAGVERQGGLPRRPALPRLLPRHRLRPADRLHRPYIHPEGHRMYTGIKYHAITHDQLHDKWVYDPDIARGKAGLHASHFRGNREKQVERLRGAAWTGRRSSSAPTTPSSTATGGTRGRSSSATSSASCTSIRTTIETITPGDYLDRHATNQVATPCASSWGVKGYNELLAATRPTPGSTATCTSPASAWSSWRAATRTRRRAHRARAQPGGARADAGAVAATGPSS